MDSDKDLTLKYIENIEKQSQHYLDSTGRYHSIA